MCGPLQTVDKGLYLTINSMFITSNTHMQLTLILNKKGITLAINYDNIPF